MTRDEVLLETCCDLLEKHSQAALARQVRAVADRPPPARTVVVVGEQKRGKSSLVNALVGQPGLSPVGVDITTSATIRFTPQDERLAAGQIVLEFAGSAPKLISPDELIEWVTVDGAKVRDPNVDSVPISAQMAVEPVHLPGAVVVDTPGVGGLDPSHIAASLAAAEGAGVLVMVCEATAPISTPELAFLDRVSTQISSVIIAITKIDKVPTKWQLIADENARLVSRYAPRLAGIDMIGVSSLRARRAMSIADSAKRESAMHASGVLALALAVEHTLDRQTSFPLDNAMHCAWVALQNVQATLELQLRTAENSPRVRNEMAAEHERLRQLTATRKEWQTRLTQDLARLALDIDTFTRHRVDALTQQWEEKIDRLSMREINEAHQQLTGQMSESIDLLVVDVTSEYQSRFEKIASNLLAEAQITSSSIDLALANLETTPVREGREYTRWKGFLDPQLLTMALAAGGTLTALVPVVGGIVGPAFAAITIGFRAKKFGKDNLRKWLRETMRVAREDVSQAIRITQNDVAAELRLTYASLLEESTATTRRLIEEAQREETAGVATRAKRVTALRSHLREVVDVMDAVQGRLAQSRSGNSSANTGL